MCVFLVKVVNRSYINVMRICKTLIYCVKLDHALYSINYGNNIIMYMVHKIPEFLVLDKASLTIHTVPWNASLFTTPRICARVK